MLKQTNKRTICGSPVPVYLFCWECGLVTMTGLRLSLSMNFSLLRRPQTKNKAGTLLNSTVHVRFPYFPKDLEKNKPAMTVMIIKTLTYNMFHMSLYKLLIMNLYTDVYNRWKHCLKQDREHLSFIAVKRKDENWKPSRMMFKSKDWFCCLLKCNLNTLLMNASSVHMQRWLSKALILLNKAFVFHFNRLEHYFICQCYL